MTAFSVTLLGMKDRGVALLLESVFGLGVFAIALVVSLGLILVVGKGSTAAREYELAEQVGRQYLEFYLEQNRGLPPLPPPVAPFPAVVSYYNGSSVYQINFSVNASFFQPTGQPYRDVLVNVTWDTGMARQLLLEGYVGY